MSEYTAEDFAQANLATKGQFWVARRTDPSLAPQWHVYGSRQGWLSDEEMAADGWVPAVEARITLDALEAAWEAAEQAEECRKGDVLILQDPVEGYSVWRTGDADYLAGSTRILSRAPKREPWADLADVLGDFAIHDHDGKEYPDVLAQRLYERGVRVVGGDDDE